MAKRPRGTQINSTPTPVSVTQPNTSPYARQAGLSDGSHTGLPAMAPQMLWNKVGSSGLRQFAGWVREEFLPQLQGLQAARTYREMQDNDPTIGALIFTIQSVMRKTVWRVEEAPDDILLKAKGSNFRSSKQFAAEFVDGLRFDMAGTWEEFIIEATSMLGFGFAPMEMIFKRRMGRQPRFGARPTSIFDDGLVGVHKLALRGQDTVLKWYFDDNGDVRGMTQMPWYGSLIDIPIEKLLNFRPVVYKGNPEGRSILRNSYRPYFFKKRLEESEGILLERLSGLPVVKVPNDLMMRAAGGDADAIATLSSYQALARNVRIDEQMGIVIPSDCYPNATGGMTATPMYSLELMTPSGGGRSTNDANTPIERYKAEILTSTLADFLTMGHNQRGAQNLAATKVDLFMGAVEGYQQSIASTLNRDFLNTIWELNEFDEAVRPKFVPDLAQKVDLDGLSNFILRMSQAGMPLFPDQDLEDFIRDAGGLPDIGEDLANTRDLLEDVASGEDAKANPAQPKTQGQFKRQRLKRAIAASLARRQKYYGGSAT